VSTIDDLFARRTTRPGPVPVNAGDVIRWSEAHRVRAPRHWPRSVERWVAPPAMVTTFARLLEWHPDQVGDAGVRGPTLHDEVKAACGLPLGIAAGYEMELHGLLHDGDRVEVVERLASLGEPEQSRLGRGRRWVIENEIRRVGTEAGGGDLVAIERFHMLGYDPSATSEPSALAGSARHTEDDVVNHGVGGSAGAAAAGGSTHVEELEVTAVAIVMGATANRVWTPAHIDRDAAHAAGLPDIFLDTSTQVGLLSGVAERAVGPAARPGRLSLRMRRPVLVGSRLRIQAEVAAEEIDPAGVRWASVEVRALAGDEVHSTLSARIAVAGPGGAPDPWHLSDEAWRP